MMKVSSGSIFVAICLVSSWSTVICSKWMDAYRNKPLCRDEDCKDSERCFLNSCIDACDRSMYGRIADMPCRAENHRAEWYCPEGYFISFATGCYKPCEDNEDCARVEFCVDRKCRNVCNPKYSKVDVRAECSPYGDHTAIWKCPERYPGNPHVACGTNCTMDEDCQEKNICRQNECRRSCDRDIHHVAEDAECTEVGAHGYEWKCPKGFNGNPYTDCGDKCDDANCRDDERCVDNECQYVCDPNLVEGELVKGAMCYAKNHIAHWSCPKNFHGNPFFACDDSCVDDDDCLDSEKCLGNKCVSACSGHFFKDSPEFAMCSAQNHEGRLFDCAVDKSPDAVKYCKRRHSKCINDNDCMLSDICDEGYCHSACYDFQCNEDEYCEPKMHEPRCLANFP